MEVKWNFKEVEPDFWTPEVGESVEGFLIKVEKDFGANKSTVYHLEHNHKPIVVWGSTIIDERMKYISIGDYVKITYKTLTKNKKGQDLKIYSVYRGEKVLE